MRIWVAVPKTWMREHGDVPVADKPKDPESAMSESDTLRLDEMIQELRKHGADIPDRAYYAIDKDYFIAIAGRYCRPGWRRRWPCRSSDLPQEQEHE